MKAIITHPSVIAFIVLVVVCAIGVYIIRTARFDFADTESFAVDLNACEREFETCKQMKLDCETKRLQCMSDASKQKDPVLAVKLCESQFETCKNVDCDMQKQLCAKGGIGSAAATSSLGAGTFKPSTGPSSAYSSVAAAAVVGPAATAEKVKRYCQNGYEDCMVRGNPVAQCSRNYKACEQQLVTESGQVSAMQQEIDRLKAGAQKSGAGVTPTAAQLNAAQGVGSSVATPVLTREEILATYAPHLLTIKPHQSAPTPRTPLTASVPTDKGTGAEAILSSSVVTPSLRDMIRRDVSDVIRQELEGAQYDNPNEIKYL